VLNGGTDVAADTRARIARLLRQHGYQVAARNRGRAVRAAAARQPGVAAAGGGTDPAGGHRRRIGVIGTEARNAPTAIVAGNDSQAFGVLQALAERGLRAPVDVSVAGFDDVPVASWATPALTTIRQPLAAMAAAAFRMLSGDLAAGADEPHHLELATSPVIRDSTAAPRGR
jgi:DNA-binding LacI/PurR family transcriptional regulator